MLQEETKRLYHSKPSRVKQLLEDSIGRDLVGSKRQSKQTIRAERSRRNNVRDDPSY